jgi:hypothetical protein
LRFVSGKARANTVKALVLTDPDGRLLFCGQIRPGSIHDLTQVRQASLVELLALAPGATLLADAGYQGLSAQTAGAVLTPRSARRKNHLPVPPGRPARPDPWRGWPGQRRWRPRELQPAPRPAAARVGRELCHRPGAIQRGDQIGLRPGQPVVAARPRLVDDGMLTAEPAATPGNFNVWGQRRTELGHI